MVTVQSASLRRKPRTVESTMSVASLRTSVNLHAQRGLSLGRRLGRWMLVGFGYLLILVGAVGTLLPGHLGAPVLAVGLVVSLRHSIRARRQFMGLAHKHPKLLFPIRRLLRREPEVMPVAWQALLRFERLVLPRSWRFAGRVRRGRRRARAI
jgi:hypothetical protein